MANLNELSNEQREQHRVAVCKALGLDPDPVLGNLDYAWMPQENGLKNLVLYAKRGVTEQLREINGVNVNSLDQHDGPGYVSFKAAAVNKKGRQEIAVGAHETEGLKGKKLADAIATAQTRALRRVTLQFAGYGILDESEVNVQMVDVAASPASLAQLSGSPVVIPPPTVAPNTEPGKDVTAPCHCGPNECCLRCAHVGGNGADRLAVPTNMNAHVTKVYADGAKALADMKSVTGGCSVAQNPPNQGVSLQEIAPTQADIKADTPTTEEPRKKRPYRRRNQVNIASPSQQTEIPPGQIDAAGNITPLPEKGTTVPNLGTPASVPPATAKQEQENVGNVKTEHPALAEPTAIKHAEYSNFTSVSVPVETLKEAASVPLQANPAVPTQVNSVPAAPVMDKAKEDEYRARLRKYSNDILPQAGMVPHESIGGTTMKLRKFAMMQTGAESAKLTEEQFEDLFEFLDSYVAKNGAPALVQYINKALGVS